MTTPDKAVDATEPVVEVAGELRVRTDESLWIIRADRYLRMPLHEGPRPATWAHGDALADL